MDLLGDVVVWVVAGGGLILGVLLAVRGLKRGERERADVPIP